MAKYADWVEPNRTSGSGNQTVTWTASAHTGRAGRSTTATFSASNVESKTLSIQQTAAAEFVDIVESTYTIDKTGGSLAVSGTSNSSKLTFSLNNDNINITLPTTYKVNGTDVTNGANIPNDPGAAQAYNFTITFDNIGTNTGMTTRTAQLVATCATTSISDSCTISQRSGDATLSIAPTTITIPAAGGQVNAQSVTVTSNTNWEIDQN